MARQGNANHPPHLDLGWQKIKQRLRLLSILSTIGFALIACNDTAPKSSVYLAIQANSKETALLAEDVIYMMSKRVKGNPLIVDVLKADKAENIYSNSASRQDLQYVVQQIDPNPQTPELDSIPSDSQALIAAVQRAKDLAIANNNTQEFHAYILTSGTTDATVLRKIQGIWENLTQPLPQTTHIYLIGLTPENRVPTASALHPIASQAYSAGTSLSEISEKIKQF